MPVVNRIKYLKNRPVAHCELLPCPTRRIRIDIKTPYVAATRREAYDARSRPKKPAAGTREDNMMRKIVKPRYAIAKAPR